MALGCLFLCGEVELEDAVVAPTLTTYLRVLQPTQSLMQSNPEALLVIAFEAVAFKVVKVVLGVSDPPRLKPLTLVPMWLNRRLPSVINQILAQPLRLPILLFYRILFLPEAPPITLSLVYRYL